MIRKNLSTSAPSGKKSGSLAGTPGVNRSGLPTTMKNSIPIPNLKRSSSTHLKKICVDMVRVSLASSKLTPKKILTPVPGKQVGPTPSSTRSQSHLLNRQSVTSLRSSGMGMQGKKNPWPLTNITFKTQCIDQIFNFLTTYKEGLFINRNVLKAPTAKDFAEIFTYIYQCIDERFKVTSLPDQIPKLLKLLNYPFQITKSYYLNVGSPHSWPSILAMLAWLVSLILESDEVSTADIIFQKDFSSESNLQERKIHHLTTAYRDGDNDGNINKFLGEYANELKEITHVTEQDSDSVLNERNQEFKNLEEVPCKKEELHSFQEHFSKVKVDYEKASKFNKDLQQHLFEKDAGRAEIVNNFSTLLQTDAGFKARVEELKLVKKNQHFSSEELLKHKNHKDNCENILSLLQQEEDALKKQLWNKEIEISQVKKGASAAMLEFNSLYLQLDADLPVLVPEEIEKNKADILKLLKSRFTEERKIGSKVTDGNQNILEQIEQISEERKKLQHAIRKLESKIKCYAEDYMANKKQMEAEESKQQGECDVLNEQISKARTTPNLLHQKETQLEELQTEHKNCVSKYEQVAKQGKEAVCVRHKQIQGMYASFEKREEEALKIIKIKHAIYLKKRDEINKKLFDE